MCVNFRVILIVLAVFVQSINAVQVLGVLEIVPKDEVDDISVSEIQHLTDELRKQATQVLPQNDYSVLTRDNILALIPPDEAEAECLAESCAVDIGRAIAAEYVTYGKIGKFSGEYSLSIELYETMGGKLLGSIVMESPDIKGLLIAIREHSPKLFGKMYQNSQTPPRLHFAGEHPQDGHFNNLQNVQTPDTLTKDAIPLIPEVQPLNPIPQTPIPTPQKSRVPKYIAFSLDALGAVAFGFGIYQAVQKEKFHKEYKNMSQYLNPKEYNDAYNNVEDARKMRDIGFIVGGVLLSSGIAVHIFF